MRKQFIILLCVITTLVACSKSKDNESFPNQQLILGKWYFDSANILQTKGASQIANETATNTDTTKHFEFLSSGNLVTTADYPIINTSNYVFIDNNTIKVSKNNQALNYTIKRLDDKLLSLNNKQITTDITTSTTLYFHK